ncbi:tyrosinase family protein [Antarctobacter sp.]|uniref:tyrosinase family protein n=1 Tax=Antarctobacter sp. TaxID=1872577 RepID=UPI002B274179|nr:tyrosinase family protein [Antarctobacter sp.]
MHTNRRVFIGALTAAAALSAATRSPAQTTYKGAERTRQDVNTLPADDPVLTQYADAIAQMRQLPASNPISWEAQARIHLNFCPHGNWFFLPWHRAYLSQFEDIIRDLSGNADWAMPYWNWTRNPQVPAPFWQAGSPLMHPRNVGPNSNMPSEFVGAPVLERIMGKPNFQSFAGFKSTAPRGSGGGSEQLESAPHNAVHREIGRDMASFLSPLDPIFWLHHCNVDRIWASWNNAGNANSPDTDLTEFLFASTPGNLQFVKPDGAPRPIVVKDVYATTPMGYGYDRLETVPETPFAAAALSLSMAARNTVERRQDLDRTVSPGGILDTTLALDTALITALANTGRIKTMSNVEMADLAPPTQISTGTLTVRGLRAPAGPDTGFRVFLNCDYLSLETPINDPHFVGSAAFFINGVPSETMEHAHGADFVFDITDTLDRLRRAGTPVNGQLRPQVIALTKNNEPVELAIDGAFEITVETVG